MTHTLEQLMPRIEAAINLTTADLSAWPSSTRPSIEIAKRQAIDDLERYKREYTGVFRKSAVAIFLCGPGPDQKEFSEIAEAEGETLTVDGQALYKRLAAKIMPTIGGDKQFGVTQSYIFLLEIQDIMRELNVSEWVAPVNTKPATVTDEKGMLRLAAELVHQFGGARILAAYIEKQSADLAIQKRYIKSVVPVVVTGLTEEEQETVFGIFNGNNISFDLPKGKQVDQNVVITAFNQLKKKTKKQG